MGDSVPIWEGNQSYPYLIARHFRRAHLDVVNMACSGETTSSMISGSTCAPGGSQFLNALAFLESHQGNVALVTIDIGGNDVVYCINATDPESCAMNALTMVESNLTAILAGLRSAAGSQVPIVGMNLYNPLLGDWLAPPGPAQSLLTESITLLTLLNGDLGQVFSQPGAPVADVFDAFHTSDMTRTVGSRWGRVPVAVKTACSLLDIYCQKGEPEGFGDDPNVAGEAVIARAFDKVVPLRSN
ncbi:MAG: SGNH/GDSL hydrolase family protein [Acidimicrobiales bacterium]